MHVPATCNTGSEEIYRLSKAILLYSSQNQYNYQSDNVVFASVHDVDIQDEKPVIQAGVAVSKSGLTSMFKTLYPQDYIQPVLFESNILAMGNHHMAWYCKPQKRTVWFKNAKFGEVSGKTNHPGLVFMIVGEEWYVFSFKGNSRPTAKTALYVAPYLNVWDFGNICKGNIDIPKGKVKFSPASWEDAFFNSFFTHSNVHEKGALTKYRGGIYALWKALLAGKTFPTESLVPMNMTLGQVFNKLTVQMSKG